MSTLSKQTLNRLETTASIGTSVRVNGDAIAAAVAAELPGVTAKEVHKLMTAAVNWLESSGELLRTTEYAYTQEQADDPPGRDQRDEDAAALAERIAIVRELLRSTLGSAAVRRYGLRGTLPARPLELVELGANAVELLRSQPATATPMPGVTIDTNVLAAELEARVTALRQSLDTVAIEERELHVARTARDAALDRWTRVYPGVGALVEGLYRIGGRADLAARIRVTQSRTAGRKDPEDDLASAEPSAEAQDTGVPEPV